jgi:hypothetical protein
LPTKAEVEKFLDQAAIATPYRLSH